MTTPAQTAANQANAKLSTGPVTEAGKQAVAGNAIQHHLTGKGNPSLEGEHEAFAKHVAGYLAAFAPAGVPEHALVTNIAENYWRLTRAHSMENALFTQIMLEQSADQDLAFAQVAMPRPIFDNLLSFAARCARTVSASHARPGRARPQST